MAIPSLYVDGDRSVREALRKLGRVTVLVCPDGCGKINLDRAPRSLSVSISAPAG